MCCGKTTLQGVHYPSPVKGMTYEERLAYIANSKEFKELEEKGFEVKVSPKKN